MAEPCAAQPGQLMSDIKPQNPELLTDSDVNYDAFHCCGDEDLVFIKCPDCRYVMVFCYECDTLYPDLSDTTVQEGVPLTRSTDRVTCPKCKVRFADYHFLVDRYLCTAAEIRAAGHERLLSDEVRSRKSC